MLSGDGREVVAGNCGGDFGIAYRSAWRIIRMEKCYICGEETHFLVGKSTNLKASSCAKCGSALRCSDLVKCLLEELEIENGILSDVATLKGQLSILNASANGTVHNGLRKMDNYVGTEYIPGVESGKIMWCGIGSDDLLCMDLQKIPFEDNTFDIVISEEVMEHIQDYNKALDEVYRVLKPGGIYIFTIPLMEGKKTQSRIGKKKYYHGFAPQLYFVYTDFGDDIIEILNMHGFEGEVRKPHVFYAIESITDVDKEYDLDKEHPKFLRHNSCVLIARKSMERTDGKLLK